VDAGTQTGSHAAFKRPVLDLSAQGRSVVPKWVLIGCAAPAGLLVVLGCGLGGLAYLLREADRSLPPVTDGQPAAQAATAGPAVATRHEMSFGPGQVVYCTGEGLEDEARKLGEALKRTSYFGGKREKAVEFARTNKSSNVESRVLKVYMAGDEISNPRTQAIMRDYLGQIWAATAFRGKLLDVQLCDEARQVRAEYGFPLCDSHKFGPQNYVYFSITDFTEAQLLAKFLEKAAGTDQPSHWTLSYRGGKWAICPGATSDTVTEESKAGFRQAARQVSTEVFGGQPVELVFFTKQGTGTVSSSD
jgi:hypothetical protein